jgi:hypothetical protein
MRPITHLVLALALSIGTTGASAQITIVDDGSNHYGAGQLAAAETPGRLGGYIYCQLNGASMSCGASDGAGSYAACSTSDPNHKKMFPMMGRTSTIQFFVDSASGTCTRIVVFNATENLALVPVSGAMNFPTAPSIDTANRTAYGSTNWVPPGYSGGIGCQAQSFGQIYCGATDSTNKSISCYSSRDSALQTLADQTLAITAITGQSYVAFTWDDTLPLPTCTSVTVVNASYYLP